MKESIPGYPADFHERLAQVPDPFEEIPQARHEAGSLWEIASPTGEWIMVLISEEPDQDEAEAPFSSVRVMPVTGFVRLVDNGDALIHVAGTSRIMVAHTWFQGPVLADSLQRCVGQITDESTEAVTQARDHARFEVRDPVITEFRDSIYCQFNPLYSACWQRLYRELGDDQENAPLQVGRLTLRIAPFLAAATFLLVWMLWPQATAPRAELRLLALEEPGLGRFEFPTAQTEFDVASRIEIAVAPAAHRYMVFIDDSGTVKFGEVSADQEVIDWELSGERMSTAILLASKDPISESGKLSDEIRIAVRGAELTPNTRIVFNDQGAQVQPFRTMGEPQPSTDVPAWATRLIELLREHKGISIDGISLALDESPDSPQ